MVDEISWSAPEYQHYPKSLGWFIFLFLAGAGLTLYFLLQKDFLTSILFALLFIIIYFFSKAKPRTLHITLDRQGIKINNNRLPYSQIKKFWIVYDPPEVKILNFETLAYLNRYLTLQLESQDPVNIRQFLLSYLPEDLDGGEQFSDKLSRKLRF
ncbi:MAG: hypothetical protein U1C57_00770 [Candidatus Doudnabacteria bacterium]|nr:hypothetical protein [bacterium]MDZ4243619.1 hypothetical protein [Candidatus Doudnabacteria bacterium]